MPKETTKIPINEEYMRSYIDSYLDHHGKKTKANLCYEMDVSRDVLAGAYRSGVMTPNNIKKICKYTGMDYEKATNAPGQSEKPKDLNTVINLLEKQNDLLERILSSWQ